MKCEHKGKYCKGTIDGKIRYSGRKRVCSNCYWALSQENKNKGVKKS